MPHAPLENTGNGQLAGRVLIPCERTIPESSRFSLMHQGRGTMLDHLLVSRPLLAFYKGTEIHKSCCTTNRSPSPVT